MSDGDDFVREVYRQAWAQSRHNELLRAGTAAVLATVAVGVLTAGGFLGPEWRWVAFLGPSVVSLFGLGFSKRFGENARRWTIVQRQVQLAHAPALRDAGLDPENLAPDHLPWLRADNLFSILCALISLGSFLLAVGFLAHAVLNAG